jgi:hypothetical protein
VAFPCWLYVRWSDELAGIGFYRPTATYLGAFVVGAAVFQVTALAPLPSAITLWAAATAAFAAYASVTALHTGARASLSSCLDVLALRSLSIGHRGELGSKVR